MKKIFLSLFLLLGISIIYSQNITNTLGANGIFSVKDGSTTFLSLNQSNRNITLTGNIMFPYSGQSTQGVIFKAGLRFIHDYQSPGSYGQNTFVGINSGNFLMSGSFEQSSYNTGVGVNTLISLTTGYGNNALGLSSLYNNTSGNDNTAVGLYSLASNNTGSYNTATGVQSLSYNTTGSNNSAFGVSSLYFNTASNNSAFGSQSLYSNTIGISNSAFGFQSLYTNSTGNNNSAFGFTSLFSNTTGNQNSAFGLSSLLNNSTGSYNSAFGYLSLYNNTTGYENCAFGSNALNSNSTGWHNTAVGYDALINNTTGWQNTAVGHHSLQNNTGNYNTAIGYNAGSNVTTGANLTLIGIDANPSSPTAIDQITLGNIYVSSLRCNVQTITSLSDVRDKKNIQDLTLGLDFLMKLKPRQFNWDKREWYENKISDGSKMQKTPTAGFIAQELDSAQTDANAEWLNLVLKDNPEKWEATPGNLLPLIVKAVQELKKENDSLKSQLEDEKIIKKEIAEIKELKKELNDEIKYFEVKKRDQTIFSSLEIK
jgi:hypothetical protein